MARQQTDHLFKLIKSLTKAEKRNFKLYVNRLNGGEDLKFLSLFDIIDKQKDYNEEDILKKGKNIKASQLPNIKANLSKNLLVSLRLMAQQSDIDIQLRQQLDWAKILYNKALYKQSLIMLEKAKIMAEKHSRELLYFEMLEFEKLIESQYVTRSIENKAELITKESQNLNEKLALSSALSNLAIKLYGFYLKNGYVRDEEDQTRITDFFHEEMPAFKFEKLGFLEKVYLYQSHVWYYLIIQDFLMVYRYGLKWVQLFDEHPEAKLSYTDLYIKGIANMLDGLYFIGDYERFEKALHELGDFMKNGKTLFHKNEELQLFQSYYVHVINWNFMEGTFSEGSILMPEIADYIEKNEIYIDNHNILVFYYKIGCMYFGAGDNRNAIRYLNLVINYRDDELRTDIQCFARILNLIAHFEMQNYDLIEYLVKTTYRFLSKMSDMHRVQKEILFFLRKLPSTPEEKLVDAFKVLLKELKQLRSDPYEKRPFLYLDLISWLESKIAGIPVQKVIRTKRLTGKFEI